MIVKGGHEHAASSCRSSSSPSRPSTSPPTSSSTVGPLFNEAAYKILVNQGQQERADRFLYNKPETVLTMTLKGPGTSTQGVIEAFNEVFGS